MCCSFVVVRIVITWEVPNGIKTGQSSENGIKSFPFAMVVGYKRLYNGTYVHPNIHLYADNMFAVISFNNAKILYD